MKWEGLYRLLRSLALPGRCRMDHLHPFIGWRMIFGDRTIAC